MNSVFYVSKSECMTCTNEVLKNLGKLRGVFGAHLDRIDGKIEVTHTDEVTREQIAAMLVQLGFPQRDKDIEADEPSIWGCAL